MSFLLNEQLPTLASASKSQPEHVHVHALFSYDSVIVQPLFAQPNTA